MHLPLVIAILAFLAFMLLPVLDLSPMSEIHPKGVRAFWVRIARWAKG